MKKTFLFSWKGLILQQSLEIMETNTNKSHTTDWIIFLVSLTVMIALLVIWPEWFWVILPFVLTYFVKAMDWM